MKIYNKNKDFEFDLKTYDVVKRSENGFPFFQMPGDLFGKGEYFLIIHGIRFKTYNSRFFDTCYRENSVLQIS